MSQFIEMFGTVENNTHNFPIMTIGEFANCFAGATPSTSHPEYWENGRIRWMSSGEVHKGHVEDTDSRITELGYKSASTRMVPIHSIVIAIAGQGKTRGTVAITEVDLCTNQSLCAIVPDERVNYSYLYHNLQGRYLELRGLSGDVNGRGGLNLKIIQKIPVILPPIEKQQQFASIAQQADKSKFGDFKSQFIEMVGDPRNNPKGWPTKRLSELAEYSIGLTYKPEQICDDGTIVLRSGNIQDGKISFSDIVRVNAPIKESLFVKEDDILMCSRNGSASLVGKVAMIPDINEPMTFGAFMTIIRSAEAKYLYLYFQSQDFRERVSEGKSSTMNQITQKMLDKVEVPFPDKDVRETLSAIASQADKSKFGDFKSQFIEMFGTVENNTHNFPIMTIGEFANCFAGATPSTSHPEYWENGRIRWMSSGEVHKGHVEDTDSRITELGYKSASTRMVPIHSIVIAIAGQGKTRGTVAITEVDLCTNQSLCAIVPDERVNYSYLYHNLQGRYLELRGLSGDVNGRGGLNLKIIQKIPVILPPIEKQQQFASIAQQADKSKFGDFKSQFIEMVGDPRNNPKGWPTKRLSELAEYSIGLTYKPEQICDDGTIVLRSGNIQDGKISFSDIVRVNAPIKESLFVKEDDILMCSRNGSASLVGKVAMIPDINEPMTFGAFMTIIRSAEAKYLYLYFQSQDFRERVSEGKSSTMNQITQKMLDKVEVPFPDKDVRETLSAIASQADKSKSVIQKALVYLNDIQSDELRKIA